MPPSRLPISCEVSSPKPWVHPPPRVLSVAISQVAQVARVARPLSQGALTPVPCPKLPRSNPYIRENYYYCSRFEKSSREKKKERSVCVCVLLRISLLHRLIHLRAAVAPERLYHLHRSPLYSLPFIPRNVIHNDPGANASSFVPSFCLGVSLFRLGKYFPPSPSSSSSPPTPV